MITSIIILSQDQIKSIVHCAAQFILNSSYSIHW